MTHLATNATPNFSFVCQHLFTAVLWVDNALMIKWLNPQAEQLLSISRTRLTNQSILMLLAENNKNSDNKNSANPQTCLLTQRFQQAAHYQQPFVDHDHIINPRLTHSGERIIVDYSVPPVTCEQQPFFIIELWGKNRQSRISEEQRQQRQYETARQMLRSVAHEVKNPLAGIRGAAQLLQRQFNKNDNHANDITLPAATVLQKMHTYTDIIINETDRLTQLIGQLLGSNQLPHWQMLNIHEPLEHVLTLIQSQYPNLVVERDYNLSLPELCADKDPLIQVFLNLLNNACESMMDYQRLESKDDYSNKNDCPDKNYRPTLHIQTRVIFQHTIGSQQHKQVLQIAITDNGGGIDADIIGHIFFPMVTHRATGTGLGLSIVQDIISRHQGMIAVSSNQESRPKQTRFTLYLPFTQPAPACS